MLSDLRFVIGAIMATAVLGVAIFGIVVSVRLVHEAKVGPIEASRPLAYAERGDWNQFYDAAGVRHSAGAQRKSEGERAQVPLVPPAVIAPESLAAAPVTDPAPDNRTAAVAPEANAVVTAEAQIAGIDRTPAVEPRPPIASVAPALTEPPAQIAATTGEAADVKSPNPETPGAQAPAGERVAAASPGIEAGAVERATDATGAIRQPPDGMPPAAADRYRVANVAAVPPEAAEDQDLQPQAAPTPRRARKATPRATHAAKIKPAKIKVARVRSLRIRQVVEAPHASTGYSIARSFATPRPRNRRVQYGGSSYQD